MAKINFLFVLHNHQPYDNFGWVFEEAYKKSYEPFLDVLENFPKVKVTMHYSGSLLEWLHKNKPDFIERLKTLVRKRQVTLLTGGFYEPIFTMIPDEDKAGQLDLLTSFLKNNFEYIPKGLWLTERVWEQSLSDVFLKAGLNYTIVDENHLKQAGVSNEQMYGYFRLENGFNIFATTKKLRYIIPFAKVSEVEIYFNRLAEDTERMESVRDRYPNGICLVFGDDGEKFGLWPHTYNWIYKRGWLEKFFSFLSNNTFIETATAEDIFDRTEPVSVKEIPSSSYSELQEWSGGDFNNFFKIYPEANIMRNRMLCISKKIGSLNFSGFTTSRQKTLLEEAKLELYKAQSGCAYWHGVFGGLYLNHLRSGIYKHLINAQNKLEELSASRKVHLKTCDLDNDLSDELVVENNFLNLYIKPDGSGSVFELDNKKKSCNVINIITRKHEPYHSKISGVKKNGIKYARQEIENGRDINIHDFLGVKGRHLKKYLIYDDVKKDSVVEYFFKEKARFSDFSRGRYTNLSRLSKNPYRLERIVDKDFVSIILEKEEDIELSGRHYRIYIKKEMTLSNASEFYIEYILKNLSDRKLSGVFAIEFNWSFMNKYFLKERDFKRINSFFLRDEWSGIELKHRFSEYVRMWTTPVYTLNETESGLSKTYQYLSILVQRPISIGCDETEKLNQTIAIE